MSECLRRPAVAFVLIVGVAGCGGDGSPHATPYASPRTFDLGWQERHGGKRGIEIRVRSLRLAPRGWTVNASVRNATGRPVVISRPHFTGTKFGLLVTHTAGPREVDTLFSTTFPNPTLFAERADPPVPRVLPAGSSWSGLLRGRGRIPGNRFVHVLFGRFTIDPPVPGLPDRFVVVTRHALRLAPG